MLRYIGKRLLMMIPLLIIISLVVFTMVEAMPGDPLADYMGEDSIMSEEQRAELEELLGVNDPLHIKYFKWASRMVTGDFGKSKTYRKPVSDVIGTFIGNTLLLNIVSLTITFPVAILIGIRSAVKKGKFFDNFFTVFSLVFISIPTFALGISAIYLFAYNMPFLNLPANGKQQAGVEYATQWALIKDVARHMVLPVMVLFLVSLAGTIKHIRSNMIDILDEDYIRTARAKGLSEKTVVYKHAFRNVLIPVVTIFSAELMGLIAGATILEQTFSWPGMGQMMIKSINQRDNNLMIIIFLMSSLMMLLGNLVADILYALVDPRIKITE